MRRLTAEIANPVVGVRVQNLYPFLCLLYLHLYDRRRGTDLHAHVQDDQIDGRGVRSVRGDQGARCGGMNQSCRSAPGLRGDVARRQL
jgi:hypothetical protein